MQKGFLVYQGTIRDSKGKNLLSGYSWPPKLPPTVFFGPPDSIK